MNSIPPHAHTPVGCSRSRLLKFVNHGESYGPNVIQKYLENTSSVKLAVDIGAGWGRDLGLVREKFPESNLCAVEHELDRIASLKSQGINVYSIDIETAPLPFKDESVDLVICNQVLEHTKELFWILHEITRSLSVGGSLIIGVPNVVSFHNRIGILFGKHPTQAKSCSAHVRCFSKDDFLLFLQECFPNGYALNSFDGSQFYPFPSVIARPLARMFPSMAYSIFFLLKKAKEYKGSFLDYPVKANLETNFRIDSP